MSANQTERNKELAISSNSVLVHLRSVGEAPALKKSKFKIVEAFLRKQLKHDGALFIYCGSGFCPTPDQRVADLFDCFHTANELLVYYGYQEAWG